MNIYFYNAFVDTILELTLWKINIFSSFYPLGFPQTFMTFARTTLLNTPKDSKARTEGKKKINKEKMKKYTSYSIRR